MKFEIGELAICINVLEYAAGRYENQESQVISYDHFGDDELCFADNGENAPGGPHYEIRFADREQLLVEESQLRKRRPPPDWNSLAGVKDKPLEVETA